MLLHDFQVLEMLILVLQQCHKENEDKWKRLSRQIADVILPMIAKQQVGKCMLMCYTFEISRLFHVEIQVKLLYSRIKRVCAH